VWEPRDKSARAPTYDVVRARIERALQVQLAISEKLDGDAVRSIAEQVANEVTTHFNVVDRTDPPPEQ
jgi:hypothetical protein